MDLFETYYLKAIKFLSYRPRSEKEVKDKLMGRKNRNKAEELDERIVDQVMDKLKEQKFINDEEFTKLWLEQRIKFKPRAMRVIKMELKQKGIAEDIIESGIMNYESGGETDLEQAKRLVQKRIQRYKGLEKRELYEKLGRFLASKGFNWEDIKQSIDAVLREGV